jgi:hypothetical protein
MCFACASLPGTSISSLCVSCTADQRWENSSPMLTLVCLCKLKLFLLFAGWNGLCFLLNAIIVSNWAVPRWSSQWLVFILIGEINLPVDTAIAAVVASLPLGLRRLVSEALTPTFCGWFLLLSMHQVQPVDASNRRGVPLSGTDESCESCGNQYPSPIAITDVSVTKQKATTPARLFTLQTWQNHNRCKVYKPCSKEMCAGYFTTVSASSVSCCVVSNCRMTTGWWIGRIWKEVVM